MVLFYFLFVVTCDLHCASARMQKTTWILSVHSCIGRYLEVADNWEAGWQACSLRTEVWVGVGGQLTPPHHLGSLGNAVSSPVGSGQSPSHLIVLLFKMASATFMSLFWMWKVGHAGTNWAWVEKLNITNLLNDFVRNLAWKVGI